MAEMGASLDSDESDYMGAVELKESETRIDFFPASFVAQNRVLILSRASLESRLTRANTLTIHLNLSLPQFSSIVIAEIPVYIHGRSTSLVLDLSRFGEGMEMGIRVVKAPGEPVVNDLSCSCLGAWKHSVAL